MKWARRALTAALCLLLFFLWRAAYTRLFLDRAFLNVGRPLDTELTVEDFSQDTVYGRSATVRFQGVGTTLFYDSKEQLRPGDVVSAHVTIEKYAAYRNGVHLKATNATIYEVRTPPRAPVRCWPAYWAQSVRAAIDSMLPSEQAALLRGILTGDRSGFSASLTSDLSTVGLSHVAAVSGLHVGMLMGFVTLLFGSRRRAFWVGLPLIWAFAALTGFSASAVRAAIMLTMMMAAPLLGREYDALTALCAALALILLVNPYAVQEVGLQLSFLSTLGLILFSTRLNDAVLRVIPERLPALVRRTVASTGAASLSALVLTTPLIVYYFGAASLIAPVANVLLLWMVNLIFMGGAVAVLLSYLWWPLAYVAAFVPRLLLIAFRGCAGIMAKIPFARMYASSPIMLAWLGFLYVMILLMARGFPRRAGIALAVGMLLVCAALDTASHRLFGLEIAVLNVGQGECVVLRSGGKTAVVDCGGNLGDAGNIAADYLESVGARRVDALILTHLHSDHAGGVPTLLERTPVKDIYLSDAALEQKPDWDYHPVSKDTALRLGGAELLLIPSQWQGSGNEACTAVICYRGGFSFVTTGDLGAPSERWLSRWADLPKGGILLAGHHGSAGSSSEAYLSALSPQAAVVSVGRNTFGHPAESALEALQSAGAKLYRTDRDGHVIIRVP